MNEILAGPYRDHGFRQGVERFCDAERSWACDLWSLRSLAVWLGLFFGSPDHPSAKDAGNAEKTQNNLKRNLSPGADLTRWKK